MAHEAEATNEMVEEEKRLKRKQSLESAVTLGMGGGKKKQRHVEAFHSAIWPVLTDAGWTLVRRFWVGRCLQYFAAFSFAALVAGFSSTRRRLL